MSNNQYGFLKYLSSASRGRIGLEELSNLNQLTVGGCKRRRWVNETPDRAGVQLTPLGRQALIAFDAGNFMRSIATMVFSSYLNLRSYDSSRAPKKDAAMTNLVELRRAANG